MATIQESRPPVHQQQHVTLQAPSRRSTDWRTNRLTSTVMRRPLPLVPLLLLQPFKLGQAACDTNGWRAIQQGQSRSSPRRA